MSSPVRLTLHKTELLSGFRHKESFSCQVRLGHTCDVTNYANTHPRLILLRNSEGRSSLILRNFASSLRANENVSDHTQVHKF